MSETKSVTQMYAEQHEQLLQDNAALLEQRDSLKTALEEAKRQIKALDEHATDVGVRWNKIHAETLEQLKSTQAELAEAKSRVDFEWSARIVAETGYSALRRDFDLAQVELADRKARLLDTLEAHDTHVKTIYRLESELAALKAQLERMNNGTT